MLAVILGRADRDYEDRSPGNVGREVSTVVWEDRARRKVWTFATIRIITAAVHVLPFRLARRMELKPGSFRRDPGFTFALSPIPVERDKGFARARIDRQANDESREREAGSHAALASSAGSADGARAIALMSRS
jgi:hypothetical protein